MSKIIKPHMMQFMPTGQNANENKRAATKEKQSLKKPSYFFGANHSSNQTTGKKTGNEGNTSRLFQKSVTESSELIPNEKLPSRIHSKPRGSYFVKGSQTMNLMSLNRGNKSISQNQALKKNSARDKGNVRTEQSLNLSDLISETLCVRKPRKAVAAQNPVSEQSARFQPYDNSSDLQLHQLSRTQRLAAVRHRGFNQQTFISKQPNGHSVNNGNGEFISGWGTRSKEIDDETEF